MKTLPAPYQISSFFIGIIIYLYYEFFDMIMKNIFSRSDKIGILFVSICIALQLFGIQYFLTKMKGSFGEITVRPGSENQGCRPIDQLKINFTTSKILYLLILVAFLPFAAAKISAFYSGLEPFFYLRNHTFWALALDIYNNFVILFMQYLLTILLWMIINISYMLFKINDKSYSKFLNIKPMDPDKAGGLKHLKDLLLMFNVFYFLIIALAALTNLNRSGLGVFESVSLSLFWLCGAVFFLYDWYALRKFIGGKRGNEVSILSKILESKRTRLIDLLSQNEEDEKFQNEKNEKLQNEENENEDRISLLANSLEIINKERDRMQQYKLKLIDARTIILFAGSSSISLIIILRASGEGGISNAAIFAIGNVQPYIINIVNFIHQFFPK